MAKYTTEVRSICENYAGLKESVGYDSVDEVIQNSREKVFDFNYPIFDEAYRPVLETKILLHYYTREICEETVGLWKLRLKSKMNEILPYYNKLYESELLDFNPLYDTDYYKEGERSGEEDNTTTNNLNRTSQDSGSDRTAGSEVNSGTDRRSVDAEDGGSDRRVSETEDSGTDTKSVEVEKGGHDTVSTTSRDKYSEWNLYSDTPQGGIEGILGAENEPSLLDDGYLTNARHILHDGDGTTSGSTTTYGGTSDQDETVTYGKNRDEDETLTYGKTHEEDETLTYGKTTADDHTVTYGKQNVTRNTGNVVFDGNSTEDYAEHVYGKMPGKSYPKLLEEFRNTFLNIDMMVIKDLSNLFLNLW